MHLNLLFSPLIYMKCGDFYFFFCTISIVLADALEDKVNSYIYALPCLLLPE